ncbi:MAG: dethiobiotin synthase [Deltaproteobacteria bacterium]|nr:dethiobiotin synthase [Deltaproteobacteria bacterium]
MSSFLKGIFVTGTDTGVGKTVASAALAWTLRQSGKKVVVMKPVQTGTDSAGLMDIEFVQKVMGTNYPIEEVCPYRFPHPLAPSVAASFVGEKIDLEKIKSAFYKLSSTQDTVIVEGAGGLLVPITDDYLMSDLAFDLKLPLIIVSRPSLGTLNHTLLTVESARSRKLEVLGIVINQFPPNPDVAESTNPELIIKMTGESLLGVFPSDPEISVEEGRMGNLRDFANSSFSPELGGSFVVDEFLSKLRLKTG